MNHRPWLLSAIPLGALFTLSCSDYAVTRGLEEPFSVENAQFIEGELPGSPPLSSEELQEGAELIQPSPTPPTVSIDRLRQGLAGVDFFGWVSAKAQSVGVRFEKYGTGYWLFPAGAFDPAQQNTLTYDFTASLHESLPAGRHDLLIAAIDENGKSGTQAKTSICIRSIVPDNNNACQPEIAPPAVVLGLSWDRPVDLDLVVETPYGVVVDSKHLSSAVPREDGSVNPNAPTVGKIDLDSNRDCEIEGRQREHLVFPETPVAGRYKVYVNMHRDCGEEATRFRYTLYTRDRGETPGTYTVREKPLAQGILTSFQANGSTAIGTYVTSFTLGE